MFASYVLSLSAISVNLIRAKLQDDLEAELKEYREYDLSYEKIKADNDYIDPKKKFIILVKHKGKATEGSEKEIIEPFYAKTIPYANILDPVRYFETKIGKNEEFAIEVKEPKQEFPLEIIFEKRSKPIFFEVDEIPE